MPNLPATTQTDAVMQDLTTGVVDYLQYQGNELVGIATRDYDLGSTWKIVADGNFNGNEDLVAQNRTTGQLDFLYLDTQGRLVSSALSSTVAPIVGEGFFGGVTGQSGPTLISQLANGELNFLAFNGVGTLIASDLVANTIGLPKVVGAGTEFAANGALQGVGTDGIADIFTQLANGEVDVIGFSGATLSVNSSDLLAQTTGLAPVVAVNPDFSAGIQTTAEDVPGLMGGTFGVELLTQTAGGQASVAYLDSGYNGTVTPNATEGDLYGTNLLSPGFSGQQFVNGGFVAQELLPLTSSVTLPIPTQTDVAIQDPNSGAIDYLKFEGNTLVSSDMQNYGIAGFKVVGEGDFNKDGHPDLLAQNTTTGVVDFLLLGANANLIGSMMGTTALPNIIGEGNFDTGTNLVTGQAGETYVSQLANGELDFLVFNASAQLIASDLVANTIGLAKAVGVGEGNIDYPAFSGIGTTGANGNDTVIVQGVNGSLTAIGFTGSINGGTLSQSGSLLLPQSAGLPTVGTINPNTGSSSDFGENILGNSSQEVVQMIGQTSTGQLTAMYFDSGYGGDTATQGNLIASSQLGGSLAGFNIVNAGGVAHTDLFPVS